MNSGIIIVFSNDEKNIEVDKVVSFLNENPYKVCLVDNASSDNTINLLRRIQMKSSMKTNISMLENKHNKGVKNAVKAGARLLLSEAEFDHIIYLESNIIGFLKYIKDYFMQLNLERETFTPVPTRSERNVLRNVFPYTELLQMNSSF